MNIPELHSGLAILATVALAAGCWRDLQVHRIDNWITFSCAIVAVIIQTRVHGLDGLWAGMSGMAVGLILLLPFYLYGGMAAGDVKLMAALGACLGPQMAFWAVLYTLVAGALLALTYSFIRTGLPALSDAFRHFGVQLKAYSLTRVWVSADEHSVMAQRFPYATAIAAGCLLAVLAGTPGIHLI